MRGSILLGMMMLSGAAALIHETVWFKLLALSFGTTVPAVSTVLATFFLGQALGGALGGRALNRGVRASHLYTFLELGIALYAVAIPALQRAAESVFVTAMQSTHGGPLTGGLLRVILALVVLLLPATAMGATYPALANMVEQRGSQLGSALSTAYTFNTLGAALGTLVAGFGLLPNIGSQHTILVGAVTNAVAALMALGLFHQAGTQQDAQPPWARDGTLDGPTLALVSGLTGFTGLACEVVWTRMLVFYLTFSPYAFSAMLAAFLLGFALGGQVLTWLAPLARRNGPWMLTVVQGALSLSVLVSVPLFDALPGVLEALYGPQPELTLTRAMVAKVVASMVVMAPATILLGISFPLTLRLYAMSGRSTWTNVGDAAAVNTVGGILGSLLAGFVLVDLLGITHSLAAVAAVPLVSSWLLAARLVKTARSVVLVLSVSVIVIPLAGQVMITPPLISRMVRGLRILYLEETSTTSVAVTQSGGYKEILLNSTVVSNTSSVDGAGDADDLYAIIPALLNPTAQDGLVLGLGSGQAAGSLLAMGVPRVTVVELAPAVVRAAHAFEPENHNVLRHPNTRVVVDDARTYVMLSQERYDVILNDTWVCMVTGAQSLTTVEFFHHVKQRLDTGGIYMTGEGLLDRHFFTDLRTLAQAFPYLAVFAFPSSECGCFYAVASNQPITADLPALERVFATPGLANHLRASDLENPVDFLARFITDREGVLGFVGQGPLNTDDLTYATFDLDSMLYVEPFRPRNHPGEADKLDVLLAHRKPPTVLAPHLANNPALLSKVQQRHDALMEVVKASYATGHQAVMHLQRAVQTDPELRIAHWMLAQHPSQ